MVLKLYGFPISTCTKRVAVTLKEHNVPYELVVIDITKGVQKDPAYKEIQPFGQIPYIDDDGFILYESRAICRYIAAKYASQGPQPSLLPPTAELSRFAKFEQGASIEMCDFDPSASKIVSEKVFKPMFNLTTDEEVVKANLVTLNAKLDAYEKILSKQKYIGGEDLTLADIFHLPYGHLLGVAGHGVDTLANRPNVARWWKDVSSRPTWIAVQDGA